MINYGGGLIFPDSWASGPADPPEGPTCCDGCGDADPEFWRADGWVVAVRRVVIPGVRMMSWSNADYQILKADRDRLREENDTLHTANELQAAEINRLRDYADRETDNLRGTLRLLDEQDGEVKRLRTELAEAHNWLLAAGMCDCEDRGYEGRVQCRFAEAL